MFGHFLQKPALVFQRKRATYLNNLTCQGPEIFCKSLMLHKLAELLKIV